MARLKTIPVAWRLGAQLVLVAVLAACDGASHDDQLRQIMASKYLSHNESVSFDENNLAARVRGSKDGGLTFVVSYDRHRQITYVQLPGPGRGSFSCYRCPTSDHTDCSSIRCPIVAPEWARESVQSEYDIELLSAFEGAPDSAGGEDESDTASRHGLRLLPWNRDDRVVTNSEQQAGGSGAIDNDYDAWNAGDRPVDDLARGAESTSADVEAENRAGLRIAAWERDGQSTPASSSDAAEAERRSFANQTESSGDSDLVGKADSAERQEGGNWMSSSHERAAIIGGLFAVVAAIVGAIVAAWLRG